MDVTPAPRTVGTEWQSRDRRFHRPSKAIRMQSPSLECRGAGRVLGGSVCTAAGYPRSAAIFNSKACRLCEVKNKPLYMRVKTPVGTAEFCSVLAHQLSTMSKLPPQHPRALGLELCVGPFPALCVVTSGSSTVPGGTGSMGPKLALQCTSGTVVHLATCTSLHQRSEEAARMRAAFGEFFVCTELRGFQFPFVNSREGPQFQGPEWCLQRQDEGQVHDEGTEKHAEGRRGSSVNSASLAWRRGFASADPPPWVS